MDKEYVLDKNEVVNLLKSVHVSLYDKAISPIKLQKGLYFLFAFWGGRIRKAKKTELDLVEKYTEYLFNPAFEAWSYGPVDREVYSKNKHGALNVYDVDKAVEYLERQDDFVKSFLEELIPQIFNSGDFGLVNLSHKDNAWIDNYDARALYNDTQIPSEDIIVEYANK
ncbi:hypothetical protein A4S06_10830 [Erysipelotrichaceae bacterium MTC7]|nr:hypothetical protein A4S06_10830 [Erysipelotrichaceae bacterium MTC7]